MPRFSGAVHALHMPSRGLQALWFIAVLAANGNEGEENVSTQEPRLSAGRVDAPTQSWWKRLKQRLDRRLQSTPAQTDPGFTTLRSSLCAAPSPPTDRPTYLLPEKAPPGLCAYCKSPTISDICRYDALDCSGIPQGGSCRIRCKAPFVGAATVARCEITGQTEEQELVYELPSCRSLIRQDQVSCGDPPVIPVGYEQQELTTEWICSKGYFGKAVRTCALETRNTTCELVAEFSGCLKLTGCGPPALSINNTYSEFPPCAYATDGCESLGYGQSCMITCRPPFKGSAVTAQCPVNNVIPNGTLVYPQPDCQPVCPDPENIPPGYDMYTQHINGIKTFQFRCSPGYIGVAEKVCSVDRRCKRTVSLVGCKKLEPCAPPALDPCRYEFPSCTANNFSAGTTCEVACRAPNSGDPREATCNASNTDATAPLTFQLPWCTLECPDPLPLPDGYWSNPPGYRCAPGYTGLAIKSCGLRRSDCSMQVEFSGCQKLVGCKALPPKPAWPAKYNRCELNTTQCDTIVPIGGSCDVFCKPPYEGFFSRGTCPSRNTDPGRDIDYDPPSCTLPECPAPIPSGYMKTETGWRCARGYGGTVKSSCTDCGALVLTGCVTAVPCLPLSVVDNCLTNVTLCSEGLGAGETCEITCGNAYRGEPTYASCPADNIDPGTQMTWTAPQCTLHCDNPDPMPPGYEIEILKDGSRRFWCATGYIGTAKSHCTLMPGCSTELNLTGCMKLQPCLPLQIDHPERYHYQDCSSVPPGGQCTVKCTGAWNGNEATARCPNNNINPLQPLVLPEDWWLNAHGVYYNRAWPPKCTLRCDTVPHGYEKTQDGTWRCAKGFHGVIDPKSCRINPRCSEAIHLSGCRELLPCTVPHLDACKHDVSGCNGFQRGTSCQVRCKFPYAGAPATLHCPINNTVTNGGLEGELPDCSIDECLDPNPMPPGYTKSSGSWQCQRGYTGQAKKFCLAKPNHTIPHLAKQAMLDQYGIQQPNCTRYGFLQGCIITAPCSRLTIEDTCMFAAPRCNAALVNGSNNTTQLVIEPLEAGQSCEVICKTPYKARGSYVRCPPTNTDPSNMPVWDRPSCELDCPKPGPPAGYELGSDDTWRCSAGYTGTALRNCTLLPGCESNANYSGCKKLQSCRPFESTKCGINNSCTESVAPGGTCSVACTLGHVGGPFLGSCNPKNTIEDALLEWPTGAPKCKRTFPEGYCYDPVPVPPGYMRLNKTGNWTCAAGYVGAPVAMCNAVSSNPCGEVLNLSGCIELVPCKAPQVDGCWFDISNCSNVMGGSSCQIKCRTPAAGNASEATCTPNNTDPLRELEYRLPTCTIPTCDAPDPLTNGFEVAGENSDNTNEWKCASGFAGIVDATCIFDRSCVPVLQLKGCSPLQSCVGPAAALDLCKYSINACYNSPLLNMPGGNDGYMTVQPGGYCELTCRGKFIGVPTTGRCPLNNTDSLTQITYDPPANCDCPDNELDWPEGYNQSDQSAAVNAGKGVSDKDWICEEGYGGTASILCTVADGCEPKVLFSGCGRLQRCRPINFTGQCQYDLSECDKGLDVGESCQVHCQAPASGTAVNFSCPEENTIPSRWPIPATDEGLITDTSLSQAEYLLHLPQCTAPEWCPDPNPLPSGYSRIGNEGGEVAGNYQCAAGFAISPRLKRTCMISNKSIDVNGTMPCELKAHFEGCSPIVNCSGIDDRMVDTCKYDISACPTTSFAGSACEIRCSSPLYVGNETKTATCPSGNTNPSGQLAMPQDLKCEAVCPVPNPIPAGYERVSTTWQCAPGYLGTAQASCNIRGLYSSETRKMICSSDLTLSGCVRMAACQAPSLNPCIFDASNCSNVGGGQNCSIRCKSPPYQGMPTNGSCPMGNMDPLRQLDFEVPNCSLRCPVPTSQDMPDGYNYSNGSFECLAGWFGSPTAECKSDIETCAYGFALSGCGQSSPCVGVNISEPPGQCMFEVSPPSCAQTWPGDPAPNFGRGAGGSCTVGCRLPCTARVGELAVTSVSCPSTNINMRLPLQGFLPNCSFDCDPILPSGGYSKGADGEWKCAEGFAGTVELSCRSGDICDDELKIVGCLPLQPCIAPEIEVLPCTYVTSSCEGINPNSSCEVACRAPFYLGGARPAHCPHNNTDIQGQTVVPMLPDCNWNESMACPDPLRAPAGYAFRDGSWRCAPGYAGKAERSCGLRRVRSGSKNCMAEAVLTGCAILEFCIEPQTLDCKYNTSQVQNLMASFGNFIYCGLPYDGTPSYAQCPADNNRPGLEPKYEWPDCRPACPAAPGQPTPPGYLWDDATKTWGCSDGYIGPAKVNCTISQDCEWMLDYDGCEKLEPCAELNVSSCELDISNCTGLDQGDTCEIRCQSPYFFGTSTLAKCPDGNTIVDREIIYTLPVCEVQCPDPDPPPIGYVKTEFGEFECAPGYAWNPRAGNLSEEEQRENAKVKKTCVTTLNATKCVTTTHLDGCFKIVPCKSPDPRTQPPCLFNTSLCGSVAAGGSCNVSCNAPFSGTIGHGSCKVNNTNPHRPLAYTWPTCSLSLCPDPTGPPPAGYVKIGGVGSASWKCDDGFTGTPQLTCAASDFTRITSDSHDCSVTSKLTGCVIEVPCNPLPLDTCMLDTSNCSEGVPEGGSCDVVCKKPYVGIPGAAHCPAQNTDPRTLPSLTSPSCALDCSPLEDSIPEGYQKKPGGGWECIANYSGHVVERCYLKYDGSLCGNPTLLVRGCFPLTDCVAPVVDLCKFDVSDCQDVARGESCSISCRAPFSGQSTIARCALNNTDRLEGLERNLPNCMFDVCPDPSTMPLGYVSQGGGKYSCAQGYIGKVIRACSAFAESGSSIGNAAVGPQCRPEAVFTGCKIEAEIVPCMAPVITDRCVQNSTSCTDSALQPGGRCEIGCLQPYYKGDYMPAECPVDNTNTSGGLIWTPPICSLWCTLPTLEEEPAYIRKIWGNSQSSEGWMCSPGYIGAPNVSCELLPAVPGQQCGVARLKMSGCIRLESCVALRSEDVSFYISTPAAPPSRGELLRQPGEGFEIDTSGCSSLGPGMQCLVGCRPPFEGPVVIAECPPGNTDRFTVPKLSAAPNCTLRCPDPESVGPGYELIPLHKLRKTKPAIGAGGDGGEWQCAEGYTGRPLKYCNASSACNETGHDGLGPCNNALDLYIEVTGCTELQPCAAPTVPACQMDDSECPRGGLMQPGAYCTVHCKPPFVGSSTNASCPSNNTQFGGGLIWPRPNCILPQCHDPVPAGYMYGKNGWECADGYHGRAVRGCATDANCAPEIRLSGCVKLQPCVPPKAVDRCLLNFAACLGVLDGGTCELRCQGPHYSPRPGGVAVGLARCPSGNTDSETELEVLKFPDCEPVCQALPTPGYEGSIQTGWECAAGYVGNPTQTCMVVEANRTCMSNFTLTGCSLLKPCRSVEVSEFCMYELRGCDLLDAGSSCRILCQDPHVGAAGFAVCPADNTVENALPIVTMPACTVRQPCNDPAILPAGYTYGGDTLSLPVCEEGYFGTALRQCAALPTPGSDISRDKHGFCFAEARFTGCKKIVPCLGLPISPTDCEFKTMGCNSTMEPGSVCEVFCRQPLVGDRTLARCSQNNTDPTKVADWQAPVCGCPDPPTDPPGYMKGSTWQCLAGYIGKPVKSCFCNASTSVLSGCSAPVVCGAKGFTDEDARKGWIGGKLLFGPSTLGEDMDEEGVWFYEVRFADDCGTPLDAEAPVAYKMPLTIGGPTSLWHSGCCKSNFYQLSLPAQKLPDNAKKLLLRVETRSGPSSESLVVPLEDLNYIDPAAGSQRGSVGNHAPQLRHLNRLLVTFLTLVAAAWICTAPH